MLTGRKLLARFSSYFKKQRVTVREGYFHSHERARSNVTAENKNVYLLCSGPSYNEAHTLATGN